MRHVEKDAARTRIAVQNRSQKVSRGTPNIDDGLEFREIVSHDNRWRLGPVESHHRLAERRGSLWSVTDKLEHGHLERFFKTALPGLHRVAKFIEAAHPPIARQCQKQRPAAA